MTRLFVLHRFVAALAGLALLSGASGAAAQGVGSGAAQSGVPIESRDVRAWLMRIHQAARERSFQGTFVVSGPGGVASARIAHYWQSPNQYERIESLDGQARVVFRQNDIVHTVWPKGRVVVIEQRNSPMSFPALLQTGDDQIADLYELRQLGVERVAGHEASVLLVKPRDAMRYGYRLWSERQSGLLLRAEVLGMQDETLETSAFSDVTIGVKPQPEIVLQGMRRPDGYRVLRPVMATTTLDSEGWSLRPTAPGFQAISCVRRPLDDPRAPEATLLEGQVLQTIYSDGLTHVSIFIEPYDPQRHTRPMLVSVGATQTLMRRHADWWITAVGDVPSATLRSFVGALERKK
ncbi:MAG: MucB/RseB C-terminal domain-containing protein [Burkholderiaceae bacterium]